MFHNSDVAQHAELVFGFADIKILIEWKKLMKCYEMERETKASASILTSLNCMISSNCKNKQPILEARKEVIHIVPSVSRAPLASAMPNSPNAERHVRPDLRVDHKQSAFATAAQ